MKRDYEESNAQLATEVVTRLGGSVSFDQYDEAMRAERYFVPFHWNSGWGLPRPLKKANDDKMCAFVACKLGMLKQTQTGYEVLRT